MIFRTPVFLLIFAALVAPAVISLASAQGPFAALPEQLHVTLAEDGGLVVQFAVVGVDFNAAEAPEVRWSENGEARDAVRAIRVGEVLSSGNGATSILDAGLSTYVYASVLPAAPSAEVTYSAGSVLRGFAGPFMVRNVPAASSDAAVRFVAYADIGVDNTAPDGSALPTGSPAHVIRDLALAQKPDVVIIPGDLAYHNSRAGWDTFMRFMEPLQARVPTMPVIGNHEEAEGGIGYHQFLSEYVLPGNEEDFVFRAGPVTFVAFNSDALCGVGKNARGPPQEPCGLDTLDESKLAWLDAALAEAASDDTPWTVAYFHHPPYSWGRHGDNVPLQFLLVPLIEKHGVDVVVTAHDHIYARTHPMRGGAAVSIGAEYGRGEGPVYIVTGGGGRGLYPLNEETPPAFYAHVEAVHHLTVFDASAERLVFRALRADGSEMDAFVIAVGGGAAPQGDVAEQGVPGGSVWFALVALAGAAAARSRRDR